MLSLRGDDDARDLDAFGAGQRVVGRLPVLQGEDAGGAGGEGEDHYEFGSHVQPPLWVVAAL